MATNERVEAIIIGHKNHEIYDDTPKDKIWSKGILRRRSLFFSTLSSVWI